MSETWMSIRLSGALPSQEELERLLGVKPSSYGRKGSPISHSRRIRPVDVWILELARWEIRSPDVGIMTEVASKLESMASALAALDRSRCRAELHFSTVREEDQGGFDIPAAIVCAAAAAKLDLGISISVAWVSNAADQEEDGEAPQT